jgi:hypothetical protein
MLTLIQAVPFKAVIPLDKSAIKLRGKTVTEKDAAVYRLVFSQLSCI